METCMSAVLASTVKNGLQGREVAVHDCSKTSKESLQSNKQHYK
jgi:hypothetical protein